MKWVTWVLLVSLVGLQYDLWLAKGGWHDMRHLAKAVEAQHAANRHLIHRNHALTAQVRDLADGQDAMGEIARVELGYVQDGETYYRFVHLSHAQQ